MGQNDKREVRGGALGFIRINPDDSDFPSWDSEATETEFVELPLGALEALIGGGDKYVRISKELLL